MLDDERTENSTTGAESAPANGTSDAGPSPDTPTKPARRRRVASRPAGAPAPAPDAPLADAGGPTEAGSADLPPAAPADAPKRTRRARATAKSTAERPAASPVQGAETQAAAEPSVPADATAPAPTGAAEAAGEPAAEKPKRTRRATKKAAAPAESAPADTAATGAASAETASTGTASTETASTEAASTESAEPTRAATKTPAKRTSSRRGAKKAAPEPTADEGTEPAAATPAAAGTTADPMTTGPVAAAAADEEALEGAPVDHAVVAVSGGAEPQQLHDRRGQATDNAAAADEATEDEDEDEASAAASVAVGPPMVLFQAPDASTPSATTRRRRRRGGEDAEQPPADADSLAARAEEAAALETPSDQAESREQAEPSEQGESREQERGQDDEEAEGRGRRRRRRGGRGRRRRGDETSDSSEDESDDESSTAESGDESAQQAEAQHDEDEDSESAGTRRRRRRRRRGGNGDGDENVTDDPPNTVTRVREPRSRRSSSSARDDDEPTALKGSTRLEAKKQRRREGREAGRRRVPILTEAEFLARREAVDRVMVVRQTGDRTQIGVLEDGVLVEHYVNRESHSSYVGNVYLGRVQNVLPSMEAAFIDIGKGRNAVLYAGEVNWDAAGLDGQPKRIEQALKSGDSVLVQVTKDPIGHKGARLTSQISLPGRYLVYVPGGSMTGISRKLPDTERARLKKILKQVVPEEAGVIVRTAAEGASEEELARDVARLTAQWEAIEKKAKTANAPALLHGEPDMTVRVIRDIFNEDFAKLVVSGREAWDTVEQYVGHVAPELSERVTRWTSDEDVFSHYRVDEQLAKALDRKVWLPSGGYLVIDRTEAMVVVDVNTGKFTGKGGNLEETVTKNNIEAAEEIVRQLRLRDLGGIIVIDFIDMVLESNRELVLRRLIECLGRDRTKHQVAEVTSLGLVQMTRKRIGQGLLEAFSHTCEACNGRGVKVSVDPVEERREGESRRDGDSRRGEGRSRSRRGSESGRGESGRGEGSGDGASGTDSRPAPQPPKPTPPSVKPAEGLPAPAATTTDEQPTPSADGEAAAADNGTASPAPVLVGAAETTEVPDGADESSRPARRRGRRRASAPAGSPRTSSAPPA